MGVITTPAAAQVLDVLRLLGRQAEPVPAALVAAELQLPRSTAYRLLATLVERGFVTHSTELNRYSLGPAAYELSWGYQRQLPLQRIARGAVSRLVATTGQSAHLAALHGRDVLYVIEERAPGRPSLVSDVGVRLPAELTASGLAMLARLPARQVTALFPSAEALVSRTGRGPRTVTELRRTLGEVRRRGWSVEDGSISLGLASVAAAVLDASGRPAAAVAVTFDAQAPGRDGYLAAVVDCAALLSVRLGYRAKG